MKKTLIALAVFSILHVAISGIYASRRPPTNEETLIFKPLLTVWMDENWATTRHVGDLTLKQELQSIDFCCIDRFLGKTIYIVDIRFYAIWWEGKEVFDEADMNQRVLFTVVDGVITGWDSDGALRVMAKV
jgi:hypothetical protein